MTAADAAGTATTGVTNGVIRVGVTAFRTEVLTAATARGRTIRPPFGAVLLHHGVGVGNPSQATRAPNFSLAEDPERLTLRQAD